MEVTLFEWCERSGVTDRLLCDVVVAGGMGDKGAVWLASAMPSLSHLRKLILESECDCAFTC